MEALLLTRVRAAFCARIVGFGRVILGAGGGRAAVCGEAASGLKGALELGITMGGASRSCGSDCGCGLLATVCGGGELRDDHADIIARRRQEYDKPVEKGMRRAAWMRAIDEAIVVVLLTGQQSAQALDPPIQSRDGHSWGFRAVTWWIGMRKFNQIGADGDRSGRTCPVVGDGETRKNLSTCPRPSSPLMQ